MKRLLLLVLLSLSAGISMAQDIYAGTWQMEYIPNGTSSPIKIELQIASPERNLLYPALLSIQCDSFVASYQLLLVKKNGRQLAISRNKFPVSEIPFSLGTWTVMLNGTFDFSRDLKNNSVLTANRLAAKKYGINMPDPASFADGHGVTAIRLRDFLKDVNIQLKKTGNTPWQDVAASSILQTGSSPAYFGLMDTVFVKTKDGLVRFGDNKDNDIITVQLNGKTIVDQVDSKKKRPAEEILLDTGLNIISFFADDYGKNPPSTASVHLDFETKKRMLDFNTKDDIAATFIVTKIYYSYDASNDTRFQSGELGIDTSPDRVTPTGTNKSRGDTSLLRNSKVVGNIIATSHQITLAIWDDAVEDGDSISLSINGKWIAQGFPVKKQPQFIYVTLEPGPNTITFVADNLGSIIPNTSVLEIIDGKKRKSFYIDTDLSRNNQVKIYYDYKPGGDKK